MNIQRTKETWDKYVSEMESKPDFQNTHHYDLSTEAIVADYTYWNIIKNNFPYDYITTVHDMLIPKRVFGTLQEATPDERAEYEKILRELDAAGHYDAMLNNFSKGRSVLKHLHIHLIIWKDI